MQAASGDTGSNGAPATCASTGLHAPDEQGSTTPALTAVIVNFNAGKALITCLQALAASDLSMEVLLVDNASSDGSLDAALADPGLANRFTRLQAFPLTRNIGFGAGCNLAAAHASSLWLLFLNPDCFVAEDTLSRLLSLAREHPEAGLVGALMTDPSGQPQRANRRREPSVMRSLMTLSGLSRWERRWSLLQGVEPSPPQPPQTWEQVDAVSGALMLMPRALFDALQGFDEGYFLHCEDLDLCRRVRDAGYAVALAAGVRVVHLQGVSSRPVPLKVHWHKHRGMLRYSRKFHAPGQIWLVRRLVEVGVVMRFLLLVPLLLARHVLRRRA